MAKYTVEQGTGGDQNTLDFSFTADDSYTQGTGENLDLTVLDAIRQTLTETIAVNETVETQAELFRTFDERFSLNDADIRQIDKALTESFTLQDTVSKETRKAVDEEITLDDTYNREAQFSRNVAETLTLDTFSEVFAVLRLDESITVNEADIRQISKPLTEGLTISDNEADTAQLFRSLTEQITLNEVSDLLLIQFIDATETIGVNDTATKEFGKVVTEGVGLNDFYSDEAQYFRAFDETLQLQDEKTFKVFKQLTQGMALDTFAPVTTILELQERFSLDEAFSKKPVKALDETLAVDDSIPEKTVLAVRSETLGLNDADVRRFERTLSESFGANDVYSRVGDFRRNISEDLILDDTDTKLVMLLVEVETLGIQTQTTRDIRTVFTEQTSLDSVYSRTADYFREFEEEIEVAEVRDFKQDLFRTFEETLTLQDSVLGARTIFRTLEEDLAMLDVYNFLFREGPGVSPYYVRNSFVQKNKLNNEYVTKTIQNMFESLQVENSFGDQEQT